MARGFSHSGRSSGGSSFGGGGFSFGSSRSSRSSGSHRPRGPMRIPMFGRTVILSSGATSALSFVFVIFLMAAYFCISSFATVFACNKDIKYHEESAAYYVELDQTYKTIVEKANAGEDGYYIGNATFPGTKYATYGDDPQDPGMYQTDVYLNSQYYYFIVYEMEYDADDYVGQAKNKKWVDSTFVQFTHYAYQDYDGELKIAYTYIDGEIWAINADYSLDTNRGYAYDLLMVKDAKEDKSAAIKPALISGAVVIVIIVGIVLFMVKKYKSAQKIEDEKLAKAQAETAEAEANAVIAEEKAKQINRTCEYCGASVPDGDDECPACGSRRFK